MGIDPIQATTESHNRLLCVAQICKYSTFILSLDCSVILGILGHSQHVEKNVERNNILKLSCGMWWGLSLYMSELIIIRIYLTPSSILSWDAYITDAKYFFSNGYKQLCCVARWCGRCSRMSSWNEIFTSIRVYGEDRTYKGTRELKYMWIYNQDYLETKKELQLLS